MKMRSHSTRRIEFNNSYKFRSHEHLDLSLNSDWWKKIYKKENYIWGMWDHLFRNSGKPSLWPSTIEFSLCENLKKLPVCILLWTNNTDLDVKDLAQISQKNLGFSFSTVDLCLVPLCFFKELLSKNFLGQRSHLNLIGSSVNEISNFIITNAKFLL